MLITFTPMFIIYVYAYIHSYADICINIHVCMTCEHTCVCVYIYIHTYIHTCNMCVSGLIAALPIGAPTKPKPSLVPIGAVGVCLVVQYKGPHACNWGLG